MTTREVLFELRRVGAFVKVTAIDAQTGTEVSIVGNPAAGEVMLKRTALQKLEYVMAKKAGGR